MTEVEMALRGILLDVDGTLVLSVDAHAMAWAEAFGEAGHEIPPERIRPLIGMGGDRLLPELVPGLSDEHGVGQAIATRRGEIFLERYSKSLRPAAGAWDLLERIRDEGLRRVVASSAQKAELDVLLERAGVADLIDDATSSDDAKSSKPAPDIVEAALASSGLRADEVVMLGDTPYDIESAARAGVGVIAVRCGGFPDDTFAGALAIYDDPAHLLREYESSPLARQRRDPA